jgi:hypothetical protein
VNARRSGFPSISGRRARRYSLLLLGLIATGCASAYYGTWERLGKDKRDLLVDRVEDAKGSQEEAKEDFRSALDVYREVVDVEGGELEELYDRLQEAYDRSVEQAEAVRGDIDRVRTVSEDLFREWEGELERYSDAELRRRSQESLGQARGEFGRLMSAMERAEASMEPPLERFEDQVLFLKHNLNARAIASLETERGRIADDIERLVAEMERSIQEADTFIQSMQAP